MFKKLFYSISVLGLCSLAAFSTFAQEAVQLPSAQTKSTEIKMPKKRSYSRRVPKAEAVVIATNTQNYKEDLIAAILFHNLMNMIATQRYQIPAYQVAALRKDITERAVKDLDDCNETFLTPYFANPSSVWTSLKKATDDQMEAYNFAYVGQAQDLEKDQAALLAQIDEAAENVEKAKKSAKEASKDIETQVDDDVRNEMVEVLVGYAVLNDFYPNQDEWGARVSSSTSSLPIWKDQMYLYNEKTWKPKYKAIVNHCAEQGVPLALKEAAVSDKSKYDYYFYKDVQNAHTAFTSAASAQGCILKSDMMTAPKVAPRPLPPVYEQIIVLADDSDYSGVYPQNPMNPVAGKPGTFEAGTLWEQYKAQGYKNINKSGELATYYKVTSSTISPRPKTEEIKGNRLSKYLEKKEQSERAQDTYNAFLENAQELARGIQDAATTYDLPVPADIDYLKDADLDRLYQIFAKEKETRLTSVQSKMAEKLASVGQMSAAELQKDEDLAYARALAYDKNAEVSLTIQNAVTIEDSIKGARADKKLGDLINKNKIELEMAEVKEWNATVDKTCITPTSKKLKNITSESTEIKKQSKKAFGEEVKF